MGTVQIVFDAANRLDCVRALNKMRDVLESAHGIEQVRHWFTLLTWTQRDIKFIRNFQLVDEYIRSGLSLGQYAKGLAEKNRSLPRDQRYGPTGSTSPNTLEKHIRRLRKDMDDLFEWPSG
jgi:hypothetical protein